MREALPLDPRAKAALAALALVVVADLASIAIDFELQSVSDRLADGERVPFSEVRQVDDRLSNVGLAQVTTLLISVVAFLVWFSRAYRNAIAMGIRNPRFGTTWAIGCWFVPFVNLVVPKQVTNDIARGSDPEMGLRRSGAFRSGPIRRCSTSGGGCG